MAFYMDEMTVKDMHTAIQKTNTVIIPVGIVEQHGFHLPLSTDIYVATMPLKCAGDRLNAVVAPPLTYCYSGGTLLGTVNVSPNAFALMMTDICSEFVRMGFVNIVIFMGHGGTANMAALKNALELYLSRDDALFKKITLSLVDCCELSPTFIEAFSTEPEHDFHAGLIETSLMMYWKPELVRDEIVMDDEETARNMRLDCDWFEKREKVFNHPYIVARVGQKEQIKVGVMGFPEKANKELGKKVSDEMVDALVEYVDMLEARLVK